MKTAVRGRGRPSNKNRRPSERSARSPARTTGRARGIFQDRPVWLDLALIAILVVWFYYPFLAEGIPPGDFTSDVAGKVMLDRLVPSIFSFPTWNPLTMCGRPTIEYPNPFHLIELPVLGFEPILRLKSLLLIYHVLGGWAMYALLLGGCRAGKDAALFGGSIYPIMTHHVSRTGVHGHAHIVMFFAFLPLIFYALLRVRRADVRGIAVLSLVIAATLMRDTQRMVLVATLVGILLSAYVIVDLVRTRSPRLDRSRPFWLLLSFVAAFAGAVVINSFEVINGFIGDGYRSEWSPTERKFWIDKWSLDNLYTVFDRGGRMGARLEPYSHEFHQSLSRYVGLSLCALIALAALFPQYQGRQRSRFWFVFLLFPLSLWLSFGDRPVFLPIQERWQGLFGSDAPALVKVALVLAVLFAAAVFVAALARNLSLRSWRLPLAALACLGVFYFTSPLPLVRRILFFLRDFRNPDWIQVSIASFAVAFCAALAVGGLSDRHRERGWWRPLLVALILVAVADFSAYRPYLTKFQSTPDARAAYMEGYEVVRADPDDFRVIGTRSYDNLTDLGYIWHAKRMAWDFRVYTAPPRTGGLMDAYFKRMENAEELDLVARLAGLANVKYIVDDPHLKPDIEPHLGASALLEPVAENPVVAVYRNRAYRPFVYAFRDAHLLVGGDPPLAAEAAAERSALEIGLVHVGRVEDPSLLESCVAVYTTEDARQAGQAPADAIVLGRDAGRLEPGRPFDGDLDWDRPSPERIRIKTRSPAPFLLVVAESFHPFWRATIDQQPARVRAASVAFLGVFVPSGEHTVELSFHRPWTFWLWGAVSLLSLAVTIALIVLFRRRVEAGEEPLLPGPT